MVIGGHFGGGDHFDGWDHFGGSTAIHCLPTGGTGGLLVYIRSSITALRWSNLEPAGIDSIWLDVKGCGSSWFLICLLSIIMKMQGLWVLATGCWAGRKNVHKTKEIMFIGDFNIDMLSENQTLPGPSHNLTNFCDQFCLTNTITDYTCNSNSFI